MWFLLIISFFSGALLGLLLAALCFMSKEADLGDEVETAFAAREDLAATS